ncbi:GDYXXLXY domain-containing protein [uncultured Winogradskyella sp.]|uniref:GDYXXLXY domain-containing protein n=1 Tax=uncultured Winogradskyella sp. TaxID=395353 RepID=UPI00260FDAA5|nr:GDYXXLXY domain-containing protein [uncultured Winogradskyella sp.]|tara:strand:+ start:205 stop:777 length:573 start_codon:yes stop_codon:yes gene_type:complete
MKTIYVFLIFIAVVIIQLLVPAKMIYNKEDVLNSGTVYKFKTQPIDPNDPFRGKYVTLRYELSSAKSIDSTIQRNDKVIIYLEKDSLGYAKVKSLSKTKHNTSRDFIEVEVEYYDYHSTEVRFNLPFDRYYMEESKAKPAEDIYRKFNRRNDSINETYALVAIKNGDAVLKDVFINDKSIHYYIEKEAEK